MPILHLQDARMALQAVAFVSSSSSAFFLNPKPSRSRRLRVEISISDSNPFRQPHSSLHSSPPRALAISSREARIARGVEKPPICTADELHYVPVPGTEWRLALWRYTPCPEAPRRNHPLVLLSGVGTNAIGFDLSPGASFARHMSSHGFDTWIVEVRGAGLSTRLDSKMAAQYLNESNASEAIEFVLQKHKTGRIAVSEALSVNGSPPPGSDVPIIDGSEADTTSWDKSQLVTRLTDTLMHLSEKLSGYLSESQLKVISTNLSNRISKLLEEAGLSERFNEVQGKILALIEERQKSVAYSQIRDLSQRLINILDEGHRSVSPQLFDLQERFATTMEDFQKQLDLIVIYDWDFDHYLEEDIPAAMEYIKTQSQPKDGKLLAIGHSMGGILLYAMLSRYGFKGKDSGLAAVVTLASSLDYTPSSSSLKLLLPLADPAQVLNVPVVPLGALMAAAHPLATRPPYVFSWLNPQISAQDMMHPELFEKLVLNNFCTIPAKLLLQLTTAFRDGGLRNRSGTFFYKDHLCKCDVPVLALAGDQDLICPPEAVLETVKTLPPHTVTYKKLGKPGGPHYGHYDLVGCRLAIQEVYPCIIEFLSLHDSSRD